MRSGLRRRALVLGLAVCIGCTAGTSAYVALAPPDSLSAPAGAGDSTTGSIRTGEPAGNPRVPTGSAARVAPLHRVVPPTVLVVGERPIPDRQLQRIAGLDGVREVLTFDAGRVRVNGGQANVFGIGSSDFRAWTPPPTASSERLWEAVAAGKLVVSFQAKNAWKLRVGAQYTLQGRRTRRLELGGAAGLGLPGVDALVSREVGQDLGLVKDLGLLINAPGANLDTLTRMVRRVLGDQAQVLRLRDALPGGPASPPGSSGGGVTGVRGNPRTYKQLYMQSAQRCSGLSWTVLAAIGQIESGHGRNLGPSSAGALGPMQFMPGTWEQYGVDGNGDGDADIMNPYDAVPSAARYLCANGAGQGPGALRDAVFAYNHAHWYVREVLALAKLYG